MVDGLKKKFDGAGVGAIAAGNVIAGGITAGINAAVTAVNAGIGAIVDSFGKFQSREQELAFLAGNLADITGDKYQDMLAYVRETSGELEKLANSLPISMEQISGVYNSTLDDIVRAGQETGLGLKESNELAKEYAKTLSLAFGPDVNQQYANRAAQAIVAGTKTLTELQTYDFFANNRRLVGVIEDYQDEIGKKLKEMNTDERIELIRRINKEAVSQEAIGEIEKSFASRWEGFMGSLFAAESGLFSLSRDLDKQTKGVQSVGKSTENLLKNGVYILESLGKIFSAITGIDDPMLALNEGIRAINRVITPIAQTLGALDRETDVDTIKQGLGDLARNWLKKLVPNLQAGFGSLINGIPQLLNNASEFIGSINWTEVGRSAGLFIADLTNRLIQASKDIDYYALYTAMWEVIKGAIVGIRTAIGNIDYGLLGSTLWNAFQEGISALAVIGGEVLGLLAQSMAQPFIWLGQQILGLLPILGDGLGSIVQKWFEFHTSLGVAILDLLTDAIPGVRIIKDVFDIGFDDIADALGKVLNWAKDAIWNKVTGLFGGNSSTPAAPSAAKSSVRGFAGGNVPPLIKAAIQERSQMPPGSSLAVANTSEAILNRSQQLNLLQALRTPSQASLTIGTLVMPPVQTNNPEELARATVRLIAKEWETYQRNQLAN